MRQALPGAVIVLSIMAAEAVGWTPPINITRLGASANAAYGVIAVDTAGRIHVLFRRTDEWIWNLRIENQVQVEFGEFQLWGNTSPTIAASSSGEVHAFWCRGIASDPRDVYHRKWDGGWSDPIMISSGTNKCSDCNACTDSAGNAHVVWVKGNAIWYNRRAADTGLWDGPQQTPIASSIPAEFPPRVAAVGTNPAVVFGKLNGSFAEVWFSERVSGAWINTQIDGRIPCLRGDIDVSPQGRVEVVWDYARDIYTRRRTNGVWGSIIPVRTVDAVSAHAHVSAAAANKVDIVYLEWSPQLTAWASRWNGTYWTSADISGHAAYENPEITRDSSGRQYAIWTDQSDIWLSTDTPLPDPAPPPTTALSATPTGPTTVTLAWTNPKAYDLTRAKVVHRTDRFPTSVTDGTLLLDRATGWGSDIFIHSDAPMAITSYYAVFAIDAAGQASAATCASARPVPRADFDGDGDVDQKDFGLLQACFSGADIPQENEGCLRARLDGDDDVDSDDLARFLTCFAGANTLPLPACIP